MIGALAAITTAFLWALTAMLVRLESGRLGPLAINAYRVSIGMLPFLLLYALRGEPGALAAVPPTSLLALVASVMLAMVGGGTLNVMAILRLGLARAFPISGAYPLGTLLLSGLLLDEAIGPRQVVGGCITIVGVVLVAIGDRRESGASLERGALLSGVGLALGAAVMWALASIVTKVAITGVDLLTASTIRLPAAALVLWGLLLWREGWPLRVRPRQITGRAWLVLAGAGLLGPGLGAYLWMLAISEIGAARTDIISATAPIFAALLAVVVLREPVGRRAIVGTLLSVAGIALVL